MEPVNFAAGATIGEDGNTAWAARCVDVPRLHRFVWRWAGGPYVEVHDGDGDAFEALNVWDSEPASRGVGGGRRRRPGARHNGAPGYHDAWAEASIRQLATWRMCRDCRHALISAVKTGTTPVGP